MHYIPCILYRNIYTFLGLGYSMNVLCVICTVYLNMVLGWVFYYLANSFTSELPWASCDNSWNTPACFRRDTNHFPTILNTTMNMTSLRYDIYDFNDTLTNHTHPRTMKLTKTPAEEFWE